MTFMSWRKDYEVGVPLIDTEHRSLFDLVNAYHESHARGDSGKVAAQVLNRLVVYAETHFQHEEKLMREIGYPLLDKHSEMHSDLVVSIFAINEKLAAEPAKASTEILQFVRNWLLDHILKHDMDIAEFMQRKTSQTNKAPPDDSEGKPKEQARPASGKEPE